MRKLLGVSGRRWRSVLVIGCCRLVHLLTYLFADLLDRGAERRTNIVPVDNVARVGLWPKKRIFDLLKGDAPYPVTVIGDGSVRRVWGNRNLRELVGFRNTADGALPKGHQILGWRKKPGRSQSRSKLFAASRDR